MRNVNLQNSITGRGMGKQFLASNLKTDQSQHLKVDGEIEKPVQDVFQRNNTSSEQGVYSVFDSRIGKLARALEKSGAKADQLKSQLGADWKVRSSDGKRHMFTLAKNGDHLGQGRNDLIINTEERSILIGLDNGIKSKDFEVQDLTVDFDRSWENPKIETLEETLTTQSAGGEWSPTIELANELGWVMRP